MKKKTAIFTGSLLLCAMLFGCSGQTETADTSAQTDAEEIVSDEATVSEKETDTEEVSEDAANEDVTEECPLEDGVYTADFNTDSSMFHVNEARDGKGVLTVKDGTMTIHISLTSKNIVNLYCGLAEDAQKDGARLLEPTTDLVTYDDGTTEEVYGFDVPVPALDTEFDLALIGTKEKWYDHKVSVSDPQPVENVLEGTDEEAADGTYTIELDFEGGSGRAQISSPATLTVTDGVMTATVEWSSPNYDYMLVDGEKYLPVNKDGNSVFEIPVSALDEPIDVIGDTVAMSKPYEIEYTLTFHKDTMKEVQ